MLVSKNELRQQKQLQAPLIQVMGIIKVYNNLAKRADVQLYGSLNTYLSNIPVNKSIPSADLVVGARCKIDILQEGNSELYIVAYVF